MIDNYNDLTIEKYIEIKEILEYGFDLTYPLTSELD